MGKGNVLVDGREVSGFNRRPEVRNRCYECDSEYRIAPRCPLRAVRRGESVPGSPESRKAH